MTKEEITKRATEIIGRYGIKEINIDGHLCLLCIHTKSCNIRFRDLKQLAEFVQSEDIFIYSLYPEYEIILHADISKIYDQPKRQPL